MAERLICNQKVISSSLILGSIYYVGWVKTNPQPVIDIGGRLCYAFNCMKVQVRKCPFTGELYEDPVKYCQHLKTVRTLQQYKRWINRGKLAGDQAIELAQSTVTGPDEFLNWFRNYWSHLVARGYYQSLTSRSSASEIPNLSLLHVCWSRGYWGQHSNSHNCPRGGVTNWGHRIKNAPISYLGWCGRLEWHYVGQGSCASDMFASTVIHTGTGGGGSGYYSYDVTLWADDWPAWRLAEDQREMWKVLSTS